MPTVKNTLAFLKERRKVEEAKNKKYGSMTMTSDTINVIEEMESQLQDNVDDPNDPMTPETTLSREELDELWHTAQVACMERAYTEVRELDWID